MGTYLDSFVTRSDEDLVALFSLRPDLADPSPANLPSLAARASNSTSVLRVLASFNARTLQVLESCLLLDSLGRPVTARSVMAAMLGADALPASHDARLIAEDISVLSASALLWLSSRPLSDDSPSHSGSSVSGGANSSNADSTDDDPTGADSSDTRALSQLDQPATADTSIATTPTPPLDLDALIHSAPGLEVTLSRFPAGFGPLSSNEVATSPLPAQAPDRAQAILNKLLWGPPVAVVARNLLSINPAADEPPANSALRWLLRNGYLELLDETHVYLPRQTAFALRGERTHDGLTVPPLSTLSAALTSDSIQAEASRAASEAVRLVNELISLWEREPAQSLRNGGLPVRELKRLSNELDVPAPDAVLVAELAFAARLVRASDESAHDFAPTVAVDAWRDLDLPHRWSYLVQGWLASQRTAWNVGAPDSRGTALNALHPELHASWVPRVRSAVLSVLKDHPGIPVSAASVNEQLAWFAPRAPQHADAVEGLLREASFLGVVADGALLPGVQDGSLAQALEFALPAAVTEIFIQGDLTGMVPGRPSTALETLLEACAVVESRGGALTVRFTAESITHAFDVGLGAADVLEDLAAFSVTPLPQPLTYLISDVARRHGQIRVGAVSSYVRFADEATAQAVLSLPTGVSVGFFEIAPGVLGARAAIGQVLAILREAGFAPAVEGPDGQVVVADRQSNVVRLPARQLRNNFESHAGVSAPLGGETAVRDIAAPSPGRFVPPTPPAHLLALVASIRDASAETPDVHASRVRQDGPHHTSFGNESSGTSVEGGARSARKPSAGSAEDAGETGVIVVNLRQAISQGEVVSIAMADSTGRLTHRNLKPLLLESGRLRALDPERESELTIAIHRIASVTSL